MSVFKCKICGGALEIDENQSVAVCEYCGTRQTLPRLSDEKKTNLYDRAGHFRRNNDFDKAMSIYEQILNEDPTDAESYWSLVLCRYGIEYVDDPASKRRVPTVNRAQFTSIFDDEDYKSALQYATETQKQIYESEANEINEIQKGILAISQKEEPFDIFICYKETDNNGRRTRDSVLATELYQELTKEGFKVFFSRITLEDKLGIAYEPYIFAALNSAKIMVVLGTKPEFFNAVWVRNEWSRYLSLIKNGAKKTLIPAYRDMDPYDLPEEFSHLQALDMSKLGFMQDLVRGIKKIVKSSAPKPAVKETVVIEQNNTNLALLLKRAFIFLEDGEFENANEYAEKVLDGDPENAEAYLVKLLVEYRLKSREQLANLKQPFNGDKYYQKIIRYAKPELLNQIKGYNDTIIERIEDEKRKIEEEKRLAEEHEKEGIYNCALAILKRANATAQYLFEACSIFKSLGDFRDSAELAELASKRAKELVCERKYYKALEDSKSNYIPALKSAIKSFEKLGTYKDSEYQIERCKAKIRKIEEDAKKKKKIEEIVALSIIGVIILTVIIVITVSAISSSIEKNDRYNAATSLFKQEKYVEAYEEIKDNADDEKSQNLIKQIRLEVCDRAAELGAEGKYKDAYSMLNNVGCTKSDFPLFNAYFYMTQERYKDAVVAGLYGVVIPNWVTKIRDNAFEDSDMLKSVYIHSGVGIPNLHPLKNNGVF